MKDRKIVEIIELDEERRWKYLKRYYEVAADFYDKSQTVVIEEGEKSAVPPEILKQMGMEPPEERKRRRGTIRIYFTPDGKEITEFDKEQVEVVLPY